mmetsp:Transcript_968/g.2773  ORF Transcript_968/g.2773 Transcript_968/m.2773 type:complete len:207 (-) Transcript_968:935-1555(-)
MMNLDIAPTRRRGAHAPPSTTFSLPNHRSATLLEEHETRLVVALLGKDLEVLVNDSDREQNPRARPNRAQKVREDGEQPDAHPAERCGGGNVTIELLHDGGLPVALEGHLLVLELLSDVARGGPRDLDPELGEEPACREDEDEVEDCAERVGDGVGEGGGAGDVVGEAADGVDLGGAAVGVPAAEEVDEEVGGVALVEELGKEVEV